MIVKLTKEDQQFIKINKDYLSDMFSRWVANMKMDVFDMVAITEEQKTERDNLISIIKIFETLLSTVKVLPITKGKFDNNV
jgi:hypothetical protein